jgi:hypothetical protein
MGKKKTYYGTSVARMFGDSKIAYSGKAGVTNYLKGTGTGSLSKDILTATQNNLPAKYRRAVLLSKRDDYTIGKTNSSKLIQDNDTIYDYLKDYIESLESSAITLDYVDYGAANNYHMAWVLLTTRYGYDVLTNRITSLTGQPCYLLDGYVTYCQATIDQVINQDSLDPIGLSFDFGVTQSRAKDNSRVLADYQVQTTVDKDLFVFRWTSRLRSTRVITATTDATTFNGTPPLVTPTSSLISDTTSGGTRTIVYDHDYVVELTEDFLEYEPSGSYDESNAIDETGVINPTAEATPPAIVNVGEFYMAGYIVGGSYKHFTYKVDGSNPTLESVVYAASHEAMYSPNVYFRMGGKAGTHASYAGTDFFKDNKRMSKRLGMDYEDVCDALHENLSDLDKIMDIHVGLYIQVEEPTKTQSMYLYDWFDLLFNLQYEITVPNFNLLPLSSTYEYRGRYNLAKEDKLSKTSFGFEWLAGKTYTGVIAGIGECLVTVVDYHQSRTTQFYLQIRKQLTSDTYREYMVYNLASTVSQRVSIDWFTQGAFYIQNHVTTALASDSKSVVIPVDMSFAKRYSGRVVERLYNDSLVLVFGTKVVVKVPWYATGPFKAIMFVVAVILALPTGGQSLTVYAIITTIAYVVAVSIISSIALDYIIRALDLNVEQSIALVIVAAIVTGKVNVGNLASMSAVALLRLTNVALMVANKTMSYETEKVLETQEAFNDYAQAQYKLLSDAAAELDQEIDLYSSPVESNKAYYTLGEEPSSYYIRSLMTTETIQICIDAVANYCRLNTRLPTPQATLRTVGFS